MLFINNEEPVKILNSDLQELANDLLLFVKTYRERIYIYDDEDFKKLETLERIAILIKQRRYSELLDNNIQVVYDEPMLIDLPF